MQCIPKEPALFNTVEIKNDSGTFSCTDRPFRRGKERKLNQLKPKSGLTLFFFSFAKENKRPIKSQSVRRGAALTLSVWR